MNSTIAPVLVNGVQVWGLKKPEQVTYSKPRDEKYAPHWNSAEERQNISPTKDYNSERVLWKFVGATRALKTEGSFLI